MSVVEGDNPKESVDVTDKPVENGQDISDHVKKKPTTIALSGIMVGEDASDKLQKLKKYQSEGRALTYVNRVAYTNMVIESIDTKHDSSIANGFKFNISLRHIRVVSTKEANITASGKAPGTKTKSKSNVGTKQPKAKK